MSRTRVFAALLFLATATGCADPDTAPLEPPPTNFAAFEQSFLVCPNTEPRAARGTIGSMGGTLSLGGHSITLPPGAVVEPTRFTIVEPESPNVEIQIHAAGRESFQFLLPATVTISYDRCGQQGIDSSELVVWHVDEVTGALLELMGGVADPAEREITFQTGHLSGFVIAN
jgi:hypothetical protein